MPNSLEIDQTMVDEMLAKNGSRAWLTALMNISRALAAQGGKYLGMDNGHQDSTAIIAIPRGGIPVGNAAAGLFPNAPLVFSNDGANKTEGPLLNFDNLKDIKGGLVADGIVASGGTILRHLSRLVELGYDPGDFVVVAPVITEKGINAIRAKYPDTKIFSAHTENDGAYVDFTGKVPKISKEINPNTTYVIGPIEFDEEGHVTDMKIGDFGDMYTKIVDNQ